MCIFADSNRLAPGEGHIDFAKVIDSLKKVAYNGYCSFEVFYISPSFPYFESYEEADKQMVKGIEHIRSLNIWP
jgi:sugar phosphate isomerase/epimerase